MRNSPRFYRILAEGIAEILQTTLVRKAKKAQALQRPRHRNIDWRPHQLCSRLPMSYMHLYPASFAWCYPVNLESYPSTLHHCRREAPATRWVESQRVFELDCLLQGFALIPTPSPESEQSETEHLAFPKIRREIPRKWQVSGSAITKA